MPFIDFLKVWNIILLAVILVSTLFSVGSNITQNAVSKKFRTQGYTKL